MKGLTCRQANNEEEALNMLFEVSYMVKTCTCRVLAYMYQTNRIMGTCGTSRTTGTSV